MQMKALRTRLVVSYNLVPYMTYVTRSTRYLRERTLVFPRYLDIYRYLREPTLLFPRYLDIYRYGHISNSGRYARHFNLYTFIRAFL